MREKLVFRKWFHREKTSPNSAQPHTSHVHTQSSLKPNIGQSPFRNRQDRVMYVCVSDHNFTIYYFICSPTLSTLLCHQMCSPVQSIPSKQPNPGIGIIHHAHQNPAQHLIHHPDIITVYSQRIAQNEKTRASPAKHAQNKQTMVSSINQSIIAQPYIPR